MRRRGEHERGAALVIVLVFMVITLILITAVMAVTGNEIQIAALHRDGVRALELAHGGIQEALSRILEGHPYLTLAPVPGMDTCRDGVEEPKGFTTSLASSLNAQTEDLKVGICGAGTGSQFLEIRADATVGNAVRKLGRIVRITVTNIPPEIVLAGVVGGQGSQETNGDTYSPETVIYKNSPDGYTYSGWRIGQDSNPDSGLRQPNNSSVWCYGRTANPTGSPGDGSAENALCDQDTPDDSRWYPGTRLAISESDADSASDVTAIRTNNETTCAPAVEAPPAGAVTADDTRAFSAQQASGTPGFVNLYGFDTDPDLVAVGDLRYQAMTNKHPCGLPYKYIPRTFNIDCTSSGPNATPGCSGGQLTITRYFKTIIFEDWFETYYQIQVNPQSVTERDGTACTDVCLGGALNTQITLEPDIKNNPQFAAIPPFPSTVFLTNICENANPYVAASGVTTLCGRANPSSLKSPVTGGDYDLGDPSGVNDDSCPTTGGTPRIAYFKPASGDEVKFSSGMEGYGTLFIDGDAEFAGGFTYTGTIVVTGNVEFGGGTVTINGGLIVKGKVSMTGNLTLNASDCVGTTVFADLNVVELGALWER